METGPETGLPLRSEDSVGQTVSLVAGYTAFQILQFSPRNIGLRAFVNTNYNSRKLSLFFVYECFVYKYVSVPMCMWCPQKPGGGAEPLKLSSGFCGPLRARMRSHIGAGNWTWSCKSSKGCQPLSRFSSPTPTDSYCVAETSLGLKNLLLQLLKC